ncbi:Beta-lactamase [Alteromonas sp. 38]|uniref:serine hydrolase domain-containing protein n=1 Tax=unclassified Alteromonas TaxID=2614992 RepID=UPI0012EF3610|nr:MULTISPECIES: serine hydrolase [unclassified Alteromonas]CAD5248131.1 Beta-lactamase [Alteromonas sp. 154]VXC51936.1 Beta-lactamase [Alteromonas sp. 38]
MTTTIKATALLTIACCLGIAHVPSVWAGERSKVPPKASAEEAQIKHWRMPEIEKRFLDIPELDSPYIDTSPVNLNDGIAVGQFSLAGEDQTSDEEAIIKLAKEMATGEYGKYDSMLIAKGGTLLFESYYKRGRVDLPHPQSSATKSYTSLALGRAIQMGYLSMDDLDKPIISFLNDIDSTKLVEGAETITLHHALTMATGIDISKEGWDAISADLDRIKGQGEIQAVLEDSAPITKETLVFKYGTGPRLVMQVIEAVVPGSAEAFIRTELFGKLGITNYDWRLAPSGLPESGWKVSVTARDMLKVGLLVDNNGKWKGERLVPKAYLERATSRQILTGDDDIYGGGELVSNQGYGYFFWGTDLALDGSKHHAFSAQGGGGMYILLVKDFDLVVVVTAHEREDVTQQLVAERILPIFSKR